MRYRTFFTGIAVAFLGVAGTASAAETTARAATCLGKPATIVGDPSQTLISGTTGNDVIVGTDADEYIFTHGGTDLVCGGGGFDVVVFAFGPSGVEASLSTGRATGFETDVRMQDVEGLAGTDYHDTLTGDAHKNLVVGLGSGDVINGAGGDDLLAGDLQTGPFGNDEIHGGAGDDVIYGAGGNDTLDGGAGAFDQVAFLSFAPGPIRADLSLKTAIGDGTDLLQGIEVLSGGNYADALTGNAGPNMLFGSAGDDRLSGGAGDDFLRGNDGRDALDGGLGRDYCLEGEQNTTCEIETFPSATVRGSSLGRTSGPVGRVALGIDRLASAERAAPAARAAARTSDDLGRPTCVGGRATAGRVLAKRKPRYVTSVHPPGRTRPSTSSVPSPVLRLGTGFVSPGTQTAEPDKVLWRPTLFRYNGRSWVRKKAGPELQSRIISGSPIAVWTNAKGKAVDSVDLSVPKSGRYAWQAQLRWVSGGRTVERVSDWVEPHVNVALRGGHFQPSCNFAK